MPANESLAGPWAVIALTGCAGAAAVANLDYALLPALSNDRHQWATGDFTLTWDDAWEIRNDGVLLYTKAAEAVWPWSDGEWTASNGASASPTLARKNAVPVRWSDPLANYPPPATTIPAWVLAFDRIYINSSDEVCFVIGETEKYLPANTRPYES